MTDFEFDCREKKITARSASHKKCGARSKRCSFPLDYLSAVQRQKLNGKVVSYNMKAPMQWEEFKQLPADIKGEYIISLIQSFHATSKCIAEMLGVAPETLSRYLKEECPSVAFQRGRRMSEEEQTAWAVFVGDAQPQEPDAESGQANDEPEPADTGTVMDGFTIRFHGTIDLNQIMNSIRYILGPSPASGEIEIRCSGLTR